MAIDLYNMLVTVTHSDLDTEANFSTVFYSDLDMEANAHLKTALSFDLVWKLLLVFTCHSMPEFKNCPVVWCQKNHRLVELFTHILVKCICSLQLATVLS